MLSPWNFTKHRVSYSMQTVITWRTHKPRELDAAFGDNYVMALKLYIVIDLRKIIICNIL
jgi:hypothetical protein